MAIVGVGINFLSATIFTPDDPMAVKCF